MRSQMTRLAVASLLVCFALVSSSGAWAQPVSGSAAISVLENPLVDSLMSWVKSLVKQRESPHHGSAPKLPRIQPKEGPQMDPNGTPH